ncbi:MAG: alpha/beta fold hydrolase [Bdellovibrionota bacterium]|jgi:alpha-beta hydrolase superfamily lysophospholipase|nr:alpha/beta fold hydrolase [Bdellovibrionota bacterium]
MNIEKIDESSLGEKGDILVSSLRVKVENNSIRYGRRYCTDEEATWRLFFFHDIGEHSNRYENVFIELLESFRALGAPAFEIVTFDFKGHGKSSGTRGHIDSVDDLCLDSLIFLNEEGKKELPTVIMGLGLGAIVSLKIYHHYFSKLQSDLSGLILINPALKLHWKIPSLFEGVARGGSLLMSKLRLPFHLAGELFAGDTLIAEEFDSDPLVNHSISLGSLFELQHNASLMRTSAYYLDIPVFMGISEKGKLYSSRIAELFAKGIVNCKVESFTQADHDLFHHFDCENLFNSVYNWLEDNKFFQKA